MKFGRYFLAVALLSAMAPVAHAHILLSMPKPRVPGKDDIKYAARPCGGTRNLAAVTTFKPGETILFKWNETVPHPGYFRIELDSTGDDSFGYLDKATYDNTIYKYFNGGTVKLADLPKEVVEPVEAGNSLWILRDYWGLHDGKAGKLPWEIMVKLPNIVCDNCTLRVTQVMADPGRAYANAFYLHCADIKIAGTPAMNTGGAGGTASTGGTTGSGGNSNTGGAIGTGGNNNTGGASTGGSKSGGGSGQGGGGEAGIGGGEAGSAGGEAGSAGGGDDRKSDGGCSINKRNTTPGGLLLVAGALAFALSRNRRRR
ncbi:MAG: SCE4755 family polysaccharide monooxygenase-like protein [Deltaproteobacteria bacterium]|nr:SCE4755 family polysaccharide monooxygenase-like protein [Deltaproteobacteria bacterium]